MVKLNYIMQRMITLKFNLNATLLKNLPTFKIGLNHYTKITVSESPQMLKGRLQLFQELLYFDLEEKTTADFPGVKEWHDVWETLGADATLSPHSTESFMQQIAKQNYIKTVNSAVDLTTFFSLQYQIPIGIYDADKIQGDITISIGNKDTGYNGGNERFNSLSNIPILSDAEGAFGSPNVDSMRTAVTSATTNAVQVFFLRPSMLVADALELTKASGNMFTEINGGDVQSHLLHSDHVVTLDRQ